MDSSAAVNPPPAAETAGGSSAVPWAPGPSAGAGVEEQLSIAYDVLTVHEQVLYAG